MDKRISAPSGPPLEAVNLALVVADAAVDPRRRPALDEVFDQTPAVNVGPRRTRIKTARVGRDRVGR